MVQPTAPRPRAMSHIPAPTTTEQLRLKSSSYGGLGREIYDAYKRLGQGRIRLIFSSFSALNGNGSLTGGHAILTDDATGRFEGMLIITVTENDGRVHYKTTFDQSKLEALHVGFKLNQIVTVTNDVFIVTGLGAAVSLAFSSSPGPTTSWTALFEDRSILRRHRTLKATHKTIKAENKRLRKQVNALASLQSNVMSSPFRNYTSASGPCHDYELASPQNDDASSSYRDDTSVSSGSEAPSPHAMKVPKPWVLLQLPARDVSLAHLRHDLSRSPSRSPSPQPSQRPSSTQLLPSPQPSPRPSPRCSPRVVPIGVGPKRVVL